MQCWEASGPSRIWGSAIGTFALAAIGGAVVGVAFGALIAWIRSRLDDPVMESAIGLIAPFVIYFVAELIHGSGVIAVVVAALILGQRSAHAGYATRLQDFALWQAFVLVLESFAFLLIGLQLPRVISELEGIPASVLITSSLAVFATVIAVRIVWIYLFAYLPPMLSSRIREREPTPSPSQVFVVAWAGMRGVVSLAAAAAVPLATLSGDPFPGRPHLVFLTFVVVVGTLLLHGLTLPLVIRLLHVQGDDPQQDQLAAVQAQDKAARAAADRLDELLAESQSSDVPERAAEVLRHWNTRRLNSAWERLGRTDEEIGESPTAAFRRLRLEMLAAERKTFIEERDAGRIDDEALRSMLHGLDLEEATLNGSSGLSSSPRNARIASMRASNVRCAAARSSSSIPASALSIAATRVSSPPSPSRPARSPRARTRFAPSSPTAIRCPRSSWSPAATADH